MTKKAEPPMYVLLKEDGRMIVRTQVYWEKYIKGGGGSRWEVVAEHEDHKALLKMIEIATDTLPENEKNRNELANNSDEHVHKMWPIH
jgi:hypothetical protein